MRYTVTMSFDGDEFRASVRPGGQPGVVAMDSAQTLFVGVEATGPAQAVTEAWQEAAKVHTDMRAGKLRAGTPEDLMRSLLQGAA